MSPSQLIVPCLLIAACGHPSSPSGATVSPASGGPSESPAPADDSRASLCPGGADLGEPVELPTGFSVRFPRSWIVSRQPYGIVGRDADDHVQVALSGSFPLEDFERNKQLGSETASDVTVVQDWREEARGDTRVVSRVVRSGDQTSMLACHLGAEGHVLTTVDFAGPADPRCQEVAAAILDTLRVGTAVDLRQLRQDLDACPESIRDTPKDGGVCLEAAVLGADVVQRCGRALESQGWTPAPAIGEAIPHGSDGRACWSAPP